MLVQRESIKPQKGDNNLDIPEACQIEESCQLWPKRIPPLKWQSHWAKKTLSSLKGSLNSGLLVANADSGRLETHSAELAALDQQH